MPASQAPASQLPPPIAVVGVGALFPGSADKLGFWRDIMAGRDLVTEVPPTHWLSEDYYDPDPAATDKIYAKRGAFLQASDFNPLEFAIPPANLSSTDTAQLLALLVAKQVLEDAAGSQFAAMDRSRMSVVLGVASATELVTQLSARMQRPVWAHALRQHGFSADQVEAICNRISSQYVPWTENSFPGMLGNVVAGRIANRFDLAGTNCVVDAACASSLAALHLAVMELASHHSDLVITGGVDALNDVLMYSCFSKTPALSPTGDCRPFAAAADGTILGEGVGMLALKRLSDAERDADRIYAVIKGLGTSSDGLSKSIYAPVAEGQAKALQRAYDAAGYTAGTVELLEAHGTGTRAGDLAEFQGMARVFEGADTSRKGWCALGSVKSQIGHTKAAAGSAGLFKAVMALHHKVLPPTIKIDEPNPALNLPDSPFYLNTSARPWIRGGDHPRRASVSSFGFGGSNFHVTLEEYTGAAPRRLRLPMHEHELVLIGAESADQLVQHCRSLALCADNLAHIAHQSRQSWRGGSHRLALVVTAANAEATMAQALMQIERQPGQAFALPGDAVHYGVGPALGKLGLLFSGQGSQYLGMGRGLAMAFDAARGVWDRAADLGLAPQPLHDVVFARPVFSDAERQAQEQTLTETQWAQPAIGAVQLSQLALLRQVGIEPAALAGHSFGEFTALAAAGSLSPNDLLRVARRRGELMASQVGMPGAMTAVMGGRADLAEQVAAAGLGVVVANHNSPGQVVFSGPRPGIEALEQWLLQRQLQFRRLPVSTAFHSPLVEGAVEPLRQFLAGIDVRPAAVPVYSNTTAQPYPADPSAMRMQLAAQLAAPVRFQEQLENMYAAGVRIFVEVGPRASLAGFVDQTLGTRPHATVSLDRQGTDGVAALCSALARLAAAGVAIHPAELWRGYEEPADPSQRKKAPLTFPILGSNYGKPYPPAAGTRAASAAPTASAAPPAPLPAAPVAAQSTSPATVYVPATASPMATSLQAASHAPVGATAGTLPGSVADAQLREVLYAVVAEKTGYPQEMLDPDQELESGLGIDSIKRVEILSAFRDRVPGLPEVAPSQLASLNTLGEVLGFMRANASKPASVGSTAPLQAEPAEQVTAASAAATTAAQGHASAEAPSDAHALREALLAVVSDKTGYPADMLDLALELEAGLGIDSIKRVEILSAFRDRVPGLPEVAPSQLAALNTLGEVLGFMQANATPPAGAAAGAGQASLRQAPKSERLEVAAAAAATAVAAIVASAAAATAPASSGHAEALREALLAVVSDKTGYPANMLDLSLELEAGLGIDSIKRVEILSAFRDRVPGLPEVAPSQLAALNTLGEVLGFMQTNAQPQAGAASQEATGRAQVQRVDPVADISIAAGAAAPSAPLAVSADALRVALLEVVSEKTGYPADMLDLTLELEAGLGIDSIKRVEILSAFRDHVPGLPEVAPSQLAALNTLGEVLDFMLANSQAHSGHDAKAVPRQSLGEPSAGPAEASAAPTTTSAAPAAALSVDADALRQALLAVVSEKTGYPADMLDLSLELEAGLGIDSIKRVEILSAFRDRVPGLPEVAPSQLAALNTLGEVLGFMQANAQAPAAANVRSNPAQATTQDERTAGTTPGAAAMPLAKLPRHAVRAVPQPAAGFAMPGLLQPGAVIAVTDDGHGVARLLVQALQTRGVYARVVNEPAAPVDCTGLIVLDGLHPVVDARQAIRVNRRAFEFVQALAPRLSDRDGLLVTVQDTGGDFGLSGRAGVRAYLGGIAALARTAANEWPQAAVKAIDLEVGGRAPAAVAKALIEELFQGGPEREVGLPARGARLTLTTESSQAPGGGCVVDAASVVLATGGARGVTAVCLQALAALKPKIAVLARTPLEDEPQEVRAAQSDAEIKRALLDHETRQGRKVTPLQLSRMAQGVQAAREVRRNLKAMQDAGATVMYCVADVANADSVAQALHEVRRHFGPITCLVHGAGVLADKLIKDKTLEQYDSVFATKVEGLLHLLDALDQDPLQAMVMFSSVAARVGNPGQCDYAMANEVLNQVALAEAPRRPGCLVRSIGWGPWDGGMVTPALRAHFDAQGVSLIEPASGAAAFMAELHAGGPEVQLVVGTGEPRELLARDTGHRGAVTADVVLNPQRYPFLSSHCIGSEPVVPMVLATEWFVRAAMALMPGVGLPALQDVRVLRGIVLRDWGRADSRLRVTARFEPGAGRRLRCELHSADGQVLHYSATADFSDASAPPALAPAHAGPAPLTASGESLYATPALFHGPDLQAIRRLGSHGDGRVDAELYGSWALGWDAKDLLLDIAALDGGLQVALAWLYRSAGAAMLPTRLGEVRFARNHSPGDTIRCSMQMRSTNTLQAVCDIRLEGGDWTISLTGVELHARVTLPAASVQG